jgi:Holliday junction DNA helicase RuvA
MYDFLRGTVANLDTSGRLSLEVGGVGYSLRVSEQTRRRIPLDGSVVLVYVRLIVREDDLILFGFYDPAERAAFDLLTSVQQIGPTAAMSVLSELGVGTLRQALISRDAAKLRSVKGIGPKSAERITLELADKVERIPAPTLVSDVGVPATAVGSAFEEAHRALIVLGFSGKEAAEALTKANKPQMKSEELLRAALTILR